MWRNSMYWQLAHTHTQRKTHTEDCDECDVWRKTTLPWPNPMREAFLLHQDVLTQHLQMNTHTPDIWWASHMNTHTPHPRPRQDSRPEYRSLHTHTHTHTHTYVHTHTEPCRWNDVSRSPALLSLLSISRCAAVGHGGWGCRWWRHVARCLASVPGSRCSARARLSRESSCQSLHVLSGAEAAAESRAWRCLFARECACVWPGLVPRAVNGSCRSSAAFRHTGVTSPQVSCDTSQKSPDVILWSTLPWCKLYYHGRLLWYINMN